MLEESSKAKQPFKWTDPTNFITDRQRSFYENKELLDATLIAGPESVKIEAHKLVLSSSSDYLLAAFRSSNSGEIKLPEIDGITAKKIVDFMYTGSIEISVATVRSIVEAATLLQMKTLIDGCLGFMEQHLDAANCLGIAKYAQQHFYTNLFEKASSFAFKNFDQVSMGKEFAELDEDELIFFLSSENPQPTVLESVCQRSLVRWVEHDRENREKDIINLLIKIWIVFLQRKFENEKAVTVSNTIESYKSLCSWLRSQFEAKSCSKFLIYLSGRTTNDLEMQIFNRQLNSWSWEKLPRVPERNNDFSMIVIKNKLIIVGGFGTNRVVCLDLETKEWSILPPTKNIGYECGTAELNGELYVISGWSHKEPITSVEKYNFVTGKWQDVKPLEGALQLYIATAVLDGKLYVTHRISHPLLCYDPIKDQWTEKTARTKRVRNSSLAAVGPYIYAVGSSDTAVERYNPATDSWTYVSPLKDAIRDPRCASLNNRLVVCGVDTDTALPVVQEYNPETDEWKMLAPFIMDNWFNTNTHLYAM